MLDERQSYKVTSNLIHTLTYSVPGLFYYAVSVLPWSSVQYAVKMKSEP